MPTKDAFGVLREFTKDEVIEWMRQNILRRPSRRELLFIRWTRLSKKIQFLQERHTAKLRTLHLEQRDEYAKRFNASSDPEERLSLLEKIRPYDKRLEEWIAQGRVLDKKEEKVDAIYKKYEMELEKERCHRASGAYR